MQDKNPSQAQPAQAKEAAKPKPAKEAAKPKPAREAAKPKPAPAREAAEPKPAKEDIKAKPAPAREAAEPKRAPTAGPAPLVSAEAEVDAGASALRFDSNHEYLAWEMRRWRDQLDALSQLSSTATAQEIQAYHAFAEASLASRGEAARARREATRRGQVIPFDAFSSAYALDLREEALLLLALSQHLSAPVWERLLRLSPDRSRRALEAGFAAQLVSQDALLTDLSGLDTGSTLVRSGLISLQPPAGVGADKGLLSMSAMVPYYVAAAVMGRPILDDGLVNLCALRQPSATLADVVLEPRVMQRLTSFAQGFRPGSGFSAGARGWRLLLTGPRGSGKSLVAEALAAHLQRAVFAVHANLLTHKPDASALLDVAVRNAQLLGAVLVIIEPERLLEHRRDLLGALTQLIAEYSGLCVLEVYRADTLDEAFEPLIDFSLDLPRPESSERVELWRRLLPSDLPASPNISLSVVSTTYELTGGQIQAAIAWAIQRAAARTPSLLLESDLEAGARTQLRSKLGQFSDASRARLGMDSLVLPDDTLREVLDFLSACRQRARVMNDWGFGRRLSTGRGLVALFAGEAGTGKTLTSEILARELDLEIHIVSIPKIVSKWVGETEKNVREVFSQARAQNALLLFDEADSLFAKRVKVERAQDHFQNMEVNNLLQEIERFDGIVILTTNLEINMDRAFERRILFKIEFPEPGPQERARIWRTLLPASAPVARAIDFDTLGQDYFLTGGQIKNAIVRAAYACAAKNEPIHDEALHVSALQQVRAAGKLARTDRTPS